MYIKFHPRDKLAQVGRFYMYLYESDIIDRVSILHGKHCPVENIIDSLDLTAIVGLTSSALVYANKIDPNIRSISVAEDLIRLFRDKRSNQKTLNKT